MSDTHPVLKSLSAESVPGALLKAERYRLLNEPSEAESICRDILDADPQNQAALATLVLALSDQIHQHPSCFIEGRVVARRLQNTYDRNYFEGILWERRAKARFHEGGPGAAHITYEWIAKAMSLFEQAEHVREAGNDDSILRWNTCVRFLQAHSELRPMVEEAPQAILSE